MEIIPIKKEDLTIINQLFEIERKLSKISEENSIQRNIERMKESFADRGIYYENPIGQPYPETRTDCEASIAGTSVDELVITEVLKPIIRFKKDGFTTIVQRAVVIVESKLKENSNG